MVKLNGDLVAELAHLLGGGREKREGNGWIVPCTAHDDEHPSLKLNVGDKQPVVWHCNSVGCSQDAVMRGMIDCGIPPEAVGFKRWPGQGRKAQVIPFERRTEPEQKKVEDEWTPLVQVPDDAPAWHKSTNAAAFWAYRSIDDRLIGYIERVNKDAGGKAFYPWTLCRDKSTGKLSWRSQAFPVPRPLYGLPKLVEKPDSRVLIVAGEKCADSGMRCVPARVVLSASGGEKAVAKTDWTPIDGREVDIWPDLDSAGTAFASDLKAHLLKLNPKRSIRVLRLPDDYPHKVDIADLEAGDKGAPRWTAQEIATFVDTECVPQLSIVMARSPNADKVDEGKKFVVLGHNRGEYYFRHTFDPQILPPTSPNAMSPNFLMSLAPLQYWDRRYASKHGCDWTAAKSDLMKEAHEAGIFRPGKVRTRGAWVDGGRIVLHLGDRLAVDGIEVKVEKFESPGGYIYEVSDRIDLDLTVAPLTIKDAGSVLEVSKKLPWASPLNAHLLAGWVVVAPFSGILPWRPHIWVTGPTTAGKTTIIDRFIEPLMPFRYENALIGDSSAAGIRQSLGFDALPILFDEAEPNARAARERLENVLLLLRGASSSKGNKTLKGTTAGKALQYVFRCSAALASIQVPIKDAADKNRLTQLELKKLNSKDWPDLLSALAIFTPKFGARFFRRILKLAPTLLKNIPVFHAVATAKLKDMRAGQQYGALLAGAYAIEHDNLATPDDAKKFVADLDWSDDNHSGPIEANLDEHCCLGSILGAQVPVIINDGDSRKHHDSRTVGQLLRKAFTDEADFGLSQSDAREVLRRYGILVGVGTGRKQGDRKQGDTDEQKKQQYFWVANRNDGLSRSIGDHAWSSNGWAQYLARIAGAVKSGTEVKRFASAPTCWIALPSSLVLSEEDGDGV